MIYKRFKQGRGFFINHSVHNSYVQISCEAGIPAALLFIAGMVICLRKKRQTPEMVETPLARPPWAPPVQRPPAVWPRPDDTMLVHYSRVALMFIATFGLTLSFAYDDILLLSMAIATAAKNVAANEMAVLAASRRPKPERPQTYFLSCRSG